MPTDFPYLDVTEGNTLQIINDAFQRVFDEEKIRLIVRIIESIKLDEKKAFHLQGVKIILDKKLNNKK